MKTTILRDIYSNPYIGIEYSFLDFHGTKNLGRLLEIAFDISDFEIFHDKLLERNNNTLHITIFNVMECMKNKELLNSINLNITDLEFNGIGSISKDEKTTYFITADSNQINELRSNFNLNHRDLHITIGFTHKDLFHERKNINNIYKLS